MQTGLPHPRHGRPCRYELVVYSAPLIFGRAQRPPKKNGGLRKEDRRLEVVVSGGPEWPANRYFSIRKRK